MPRGALPALVLLAGALPLLGRPAPLQDWPNHVARFHILAAMLRGDPFWQHFYRVTGFWIPNAAMDAGVVALLRLGLPVEVAAEAFLLATYAVFVAGFCAVAQRLGALSSAKPALAVLLFYGNPLFWGLASYVLGIGLLLALLAAWLAASRPWQRCIVAAAGSPLVFVHAVPALAWVAVLGGCELARFWRSRLPFGRRLAAHASWLVALAAVGALLAALPSGGGARLVYMGADLPHILARKPGLFARVLLGGSVWQDAASAVALVLCIAATLRARPLLAPEPAVAIGVLVAVTLAAPERLGDGSLLDTRLAWLPLVVAAASVRLRRPGWLMPMAVLARTLLVAAQFWAHGQVFAQFRRDAAALPRGSVLLMASGTAERLLTWPQVWSPPLTSLATLAVPGGVFVPHVFANPSQQPLALRAAYAGLIQPWDLTDAPHRAATAAALQPLCAAGAFAGVYLAEIYPTADRPLPGVLATRQNYALIDACRLR